MDLFEDLSFQVFVLDYDKSVMKRKSIRLFPCGFVSFVDRYHFPVSEFFDYLVSDSFCHGDGGDVFWGN